MNKLEQAARQALEALEIYGEHAKDCPQWPTYTNPKNYPKCDCGFEEAITALREALKPTREGKYYYKDNACTADNADSPDCICWHDEALAEQAEQEPVGEVVMESMGVGDAQIVRFRMNGRIPPVGTKLYAAPQQDINLNCKSVQKRLATVWGYVKAEQAEQEPVAWGCRFQDGSIHDCICPESHAECEGDYNIPLYAAPVRTKDLTDDEIDECRNPYEGAYDFARAVIAADREKNK